MSDTATIELPVKKMKLSEVIRAGMKLSRKATGAFFKRDGQGHICACAMGAAVLGIAGRSAEIIEAVERDYQAGRIIREAIGIDIFNVTLPAPDNPEDIWVLISLVTKLNDVGKWDRGRIARYLEKQGY